jgi:predicted nucleotidyltransferase component of viral defense system
MAEVPHIDEETIKRVSAATGFDQRLLIQDYYVTAMLYLLRDVQGIYFKGGTALNKIFLDYARLS